MSGLSKKILLLILAAALLLPATACSMGATGPGAPDNGIGLFGFGYGEDHKFDGDVTYYGDAYGEAIEQAIDSADISERNKRKLEEYVEDAVGNFP